MWTCGVEYRQVYCPGGPWAEPIMDELTELIEKEFSLPYFEFVYDAHWDLGYGWSGDMP